MKWAAHEDDRDISRCTICGSWRHRSHECETCRIMKARAA